jgi:branched-subunit amino acid aminotransferase/4-amino-4-deoxychorismate lyase
MTLIWCNGQWLDPADFHIAPTDRGLMHGLGLFETILSLDGKPVLAGRHLARLERGAQRLGWRIETSGLREIMMELLHANGLGEGRGRIRLTVTAGSGGLADLTAGADRLVLLTASRSAEPPASTTAHLSGFVRNERSPLAGMKCASYAENLVALDQAAGLGFEEAIFLNTAGHLCEAATANLFLVKDGELLTPSLASGCLPGITRELVISLAAQLGISCREGDLPAALIHEADEIFLTSATRGVTGVSRFEARPLAAGPLTATLREAWQREILRGAE